MTRLATFLLLLGMLALLCSCSQKSRDHFAADIPRADTASRGSHAEADKELAAPASYAPKTASEQAALVTNRRKSAQYQPLSTFSLDVDTAGYGLVRSALNAGKLPSPSAVRVEELVNYFPWTAAERQLKPLGKSPFEAAYEAAPCPWNPQNVLLSVTVRTKDNPGGAGTAVKKGASVPKDAARHLVFLVDVSGDMAQEGSLPLVKTSLSVLTGKLRPQDTVSLVTFASGMRTVLPPTSGKEQALILAAVDSLQAGGATAGAGGLQQGYNQASAHFIPGGENRIVLCTNGNFNMGVSSVAEMENLVRRNRSRGVPLTVLGVGSRSNDAVLSRIANAGSGNYSHIDSVSEAVKVLYEEGRSTVTVAARDVKAQVEFNPDVVAVWQQIGYEKRQLADAAFTDDSVDAAWVGPGKQVTILYELTLKKLPAQPNGPVLRYNRIKPIALPPGPRISELAYLKLRWKAPGAAAGQGQSLEVAQPLYRRFVQPSFEAASGSFRFNAAVAAFGAKLRGDFMPANWGSVIQWASQAIGNDTGGYRAEFVRLARAAQAISGKQ
ncbi:von Willebrand factor type A domain-containing protein [Desulfovibrio sp. OttesenSCG-928-G15]|nr:von Willebrand factor type A domain-containing protein [Desulfovibrio sp. OttesenSCG-928-G15]